MFSGLSSSELRDELATTVQRHKAILKNVHDTPINVRQPGTINGNIQRQNLATRSLGYMKRIFTVIFLALPEPLIAGSIVGGVVVADHYDCTVYDRIVVATRRGYTNAEVYRGYGSTLEGRVIFGELHSFGFTDIYDEDGTEVGRLYIDDYSVSEGTAVEWCYEQ